MNSVLRRRRATSRQAGTQIAEMALVLPFLVLLALIVSEGAGMFRADLVLSNAAREAARVAIQSAHQCPPANVDATGNASCLAALKGVASAYVANNGVSASACSPVTTLDQTLSFDENGVRYYTTEVKVTCTYQFKYLPRLPWMKVSPTANIGGRSEFRNLYGS